jgi:hypothetical protein
LKQPNPVIFFKQINCPSQKGLTPQNPLKPRNLLQADELALAGLIDSSLGSFLELLFLFDLGLKRLCSRVSALASVFVLFYWESTY